MCYKIFTPLGYGVLRLPKTTFRTKIGGGGAALGEHPKNVGPPTYFCIFATVDASHFTFGTQIGFGTNLPKTTFRTKIGGGVCARGATEKIWDPLLISATVEASNFKFGT